MPQPRLKMRRDTAANWASLNPILADGEPGWDKTNKRQKVGDGVTPWLSLDWSDRDSPSGPPSDNPDLDDWVSLDLLYENAKV